MLVSYFGFMRSTHGNNLYVEFWSDARFVDLWSKVVIFSCITLSDVIIWVRDDFCLTKFMDGPFTYIDLKLFI